MAARSIALELTPDNIFVLSMHPGWVQTDMGTSEATLTTEQSISGMLKIFYSMKPEQHGTFVQWDGKVLPWWFNIIENTDDGFFGSNCNVFFKLFYWM